MSQYLASSVSTSTFIVKNSADVSISGTVSLTQGGTVATFAPSSSLASSTSYTATIKGGSTGVKDLAGNARTSDKVWPFTTGPDTSPPLVINTNPAYGATGVPVTKTITATFNEPVLASSVSTSTFIVKNSADVSISGTVSLTQGGTVATFAPSSSLASSTSYTATIKGGSTGVKDLAGNARTSDKVWPFTTSSALSASTSTSTSTTLGTAATMNDNSSKSASHNINGTSIGNSNKKANVTSNHALIAASIDEAGQQKSINGTNIQQQAAEKQLSN